MKQQAPKSEQHDLGDYRERLRWDHDKAASIGAALLGSEATKGIIDEASTDTYDRAGHTLLSNPDLEARADHDGLMAEIRYIAEQDIAREGRDDIKRGNERLVALKEMRAQHGGDYRPGGSRSSTIDNEMEYVERDLNERNDKLTGHVDRRLAEDVKNRLKKKGQMIEEIDSYAEPMSRLYDANPEKFANLPTEEFNSLAEEVKKREDVVGHLKKDLYELGLTKDMIELHNTKQEPTFRVGHTDTFGENAEAVRLLRRDLLNARCDVYDAGLPEDIDKADFTQPDEEGGGDHRDQYEQVERELEWDIFTESGQEYNRRMLGLVAEAQSHYGRLLAAVEKSRDDYIARAAE